MKQIQTGIIGFGLSGRYFFAPYLAADPRFRLAAVVTSQKEAVEQGYPGTQTYGDPQHLFEDEGIDLIVVASPNYTHHDYAKKALMAGKHVIVEKPFTVTSAEAGELADLSVAQNRVLAPFQNRRWDGDFLTVKKLIEAGTLGEILEFESHFDRFRPGRERVEWKNEVHRGVGMLYDLGPHLIDQALCLFGKPDFVYGDLRKHRLHGLNDDNFEIQLHYPATKVILKAGVMIHGIGPRFMVHGRKGSFIKYGLDGQEQNLKGGMLPGNPLLGRDADEKYGWLHTEEDGTLVRIRIETVNGDYRAYFDNVAKAIEAGEELLVKPEDGKMIIEVIEKALISCKEKRIVAF